MREAPLAIGVLLVLVLAVAHPGTFSLLVTVALVGLFLAPLLYVLAPVFTVGAVSVVVLFGIVPALPLLKSYVLTGLVIVGWLWVSAVAAGWCVQLGEERGDSKW